MPAISNEGESRAEGLRDIYTVSRLNREARGLLETGLPSLWITGELSNFSRPASGHWYFTLKDEAAQVRCAMFRQRNQMVRVAPRDGMQVLTAHPGAGRPVDRTDSTLRQWLVRFGDSGYIVLYRPEGSSVVVVSIRHQREAGFP